MDEEEQLVEGVCCARPSWYSGLCAEKENARLVALARAQREAVGDGVAREANDASRGAARARGAVAGGAAAAARADEGHIALSGAASRAARATVAWARGCASARRRRRPAARACACRASRPATEERRRGGRARRALAPTKAPAQAAARTSRAARGASRRRCPAVALVVGPRGRARAARKKRTARRWTAAEPEELDDEEHSYQLEPRRVTPRGKGIVVDGGLDGLRARPPRSLPAGLPAPRASMMSRAERTMTGDDSLKGGDST